MKEKIIKILEKYSEEVDIKGSILQETEREDWIWSGMFDEIADEIINSLIGVKGCSNCKGSVIYSSNCLKCDPDNNNFTEWIKK